MSPETFKTTFNPEPSTWMHIDLNSCFATIEQQANPLLRGKPIAVAAYTTPRGCILAPSIEAKRYGIKTGMRVMDGQALCSDLIILPSDPPKYRFVNRALLKLFNEYSPSVSVRSIDEMLLNFEYLTFFKERVTRARLSHKYNSTSRVEYVNASGNTLAVKTPRGCADALLRGGGITNDVSITENSPRRNHGFGCASTCHHPRWSNSLTEIAHEIKTRIKSEIGDWLTVSIGISTNPYLAKLAAGLHKPDGLDEINQSNILKILSPMKLVDLPYIKERNAMRLNRVGIQTPVDFYFASSQQLKSAFESINGHYWHLRLHGWSIDEVEWQRKSIGHSYALPKFTNNITELEQLLCKLIEKMGRRLRDNHLTTQGIHLAVNFTDGSFWHKGYKTSQKLYASSDLFNAARQLLHFMNNSLENTWPARHPGGVRMHSPGVEETRRIKPVRILAVSCFMLEEDLYNQMALFHDEERKRALSQAMDTINDRWGEFTVYPANMLTAQQQHKILDRIAFGRVLDMPDVILKEQQAWEREIFTS